MTAKFDLKKIIQLYFYILSEAITLICAVVFSIGWVGDSGLLHHILFMAELIIAYLFLHLKPEGMKYMWKVVFFIGKVFSFIAMWGIVALVSGTYVLKIEWDQELSLSLSHALLMLFSFHVQLMRLSSPFTI